MQVEKIFGPPGTGKTHTLLEILQRELAAGVPIDRIAFLTFTVQARLEAVSRAREVLGGGDGLELPYFRTLHSIAYRQLSMSPSAIIRTPSMLTELEEKLGVEFTKQRQHEWDADAFEQFGAQQGDRLLAFDHWRRHNQLDIERAYRHWDGDENFFLVNRFCRAYANWKHAEGLFDFTDLLIQADGTLPVDVVIVDEAQDLSNLQWAALDRFAANAQRVYLAGDDDQAIFTWAGASPEAFVARKGVARVLGQSFRVPRKVQALASSVIMKVVSRQPKTWASRDADGAVSYSGSVDQVDFEQEGSYLILYRNHYAGAQVETRLRELGLPYTRRDKVAPGAEWGPSIVAWERLRKGRSVTPSEALTVFDAVADTRGVLRSPKGKIKKLDRSVQLSLNTLRDEYGLTINGPWFDALTKIGANDTQYLRAVLKQYGNAGLLHQPKIRLSTIHGSKGAQADHVVLLTEMSRRVRESIDVDPDPERRVYYVGLTRARDTLTLIGSDNPLI